MGAGTPKSMPVSCQSPDRIAPAPGAGARRPRLKVYPRSEPVARRGSSTAATGTASGRCTIKGLVAPSMTCSSMITLAHRQGRQVVHRVEQHRLQYGAQTPRSGLALHGFARHGPQGLVTEFELRALHLEQLVVLLGQCILRLRQD